MKILINPEWVDLVVGLPDADKAEILMCILGYPDYQSELPLWRFMKKQIDRDTEKYQRRCETLSKNRQARWDSEQNDNRTESESNQNAIRNGTDSEQKPPASVGKENSKESEIENNNEKEKNKEMAARAFALTNGLAKTMNANAPKTYEINDDFNFDKDDALQTMTAVYPDALCVRALNSLKYKCYGAKMTIMQLRGWIEQEKKFYK
ncbi:MAG: DUF6291 domain-containing protein [Rickettsiales bacterium]|jgi:hypothetical protein|nr:DUF6291 domain-containing protein [Rickettsiales bacterium]